MKKLILIFTILFLPLLNAQSDRSSSSSDLIMLFGGVGVDAEAQAYFDILSTPLSGGRQGTIDQFVKGLKASLGTTLLSDYFDRVWILANETEESALQTLVNVSADDATNEHSTAFAVDRGYTGDGTNDYIDTKYNGSTDATVFALDDGSVGLYIRTEVDETGFDMGAKVGTDWIQLIASYGTDEKGYLRLNTDNAAGDDNTDSRGVFIGTRTASNVQLLYKNGVEIVSGSNSSTAIPNADIFISGYNTSGLDLPTAKQYAFAFIGKGLTPTEAAALSTWVEWYLDAIGAGVIPI